MILIFEKWPLKFFVKHHSWEKGLKLLNRTKGLWFIEFSIHAKGHGNFGSSFIKLIHPKVLLVVSSFGIFFKKLMVMQTLAKIEVDNVDLFVARI